MNTRRELLVVLGAGMLARPLAALAQPKQPVLIGWLSTNVPDPGRWAVAFKEELAAQGWKEGLHYRIEARSADGRIERLQPLAEELATTGCAVIVTVLGVATAAAARAAPGTPIVQANGASPVDLGLAKSLARPGGMVTGVTAIPRELAAKSLELLLAAAPGVKRVGFLVDPHSYSHHDTLTTVRRAAEHHRVKAYFAMAANAEELEPAISRLATEGVQGLIPLPSTWFVSARARIVNLALSHRWPMIYGVSSFADEGALLAYGADRQALQRRAAYFVVRILKGARPGDLPIEQPTKFELVINMKTARLLGLEIKPELLVRADRIIE
ncbi:MAG: hypothetical protein EHM59_21090 [Betaproteobacteria bacterium]|nr:MAG: hypothetical protein EHM59_21090 [Betaproteobacteria bacterium]